MPSDSTVSAGAQSAPLWLPHHPALMSQVSGASLPGPVGSGSSAGPAAGTPAGSELLPGGGSAADNPCWSSKELAALQLSDWHIAPEGGGAGCCPGPCMPAQRAAE